MTSPVAARIGDADASTVLVPRDAPDFSLLGHDLRAALSEVIGGLRLVDVTRLDVGNRLKIARTSAAGEALSLLLEQALAIMLGETAAEAPAQGPLQTERLLDSIRLRWQGRAGDTGLSFLLEADDLPPQLRMDAALLERVLSNLLGNAMKFAATGTVTCRISQSAGRLAIRVTDEGPGFPENALPRLFHVHNRPENATKPGSGLGLHIVNDMVSRAGGSLTARNRPKGGAEVAVDLPLPDLFDQPGAAALATPDLSHCRILVADDSATNRLILQQFLGQMGAEVAVATDGVEAVGRLERERFDLLVVDIEMPRMSGLDLIKHLRGVTGPLSFLPILAVTAHTDAVQHAAILAAGAQITLVKPILCPGTLGVAVTTALAATALPDIDPVQFDRLLIMAGPLTAAELLRRMLEDLRRAEHRLTLAQDGPDWAGIRAQTHVLMALAGTLGAQKLQCLAQELNTIAHQDVRPPGALQPLCQHTLAALRRMIQYIAAKTGTAEANP